MLHHIQKHKPAKKDSLDYLLYFFVFTTPLFEIPQAIAIYQNQSAVNVSSLTWIYFLITNVAWLIYGFRRRLWPVILSYSLYMAVEAVIVIGIWRYS